MYGLVHINIFYTFLPLSLMIFKKQTRFRIELLPIFARECRHFE